MFLLLPCLPSRKIQIYRITLIALTALANTSLVFTVSAQHLEYLFSFGSSGSGPGQFNNMQGINIDQTGQINVADGGNDRVQVFDSDGIFQFAFGSSGNGEGEFDFPIDITFDGNGLVYVSDNNNERIQVFDNAGAFQFGFDLPTTGRALPLGLAFSGNGQLYAAVNQRIQVFDTNGAFQFEFGSTGSGLGQFVTPAGVEVDAFENVYVSDTENDRISVFSGNGSFQFSFGISGTGPGEFNVPALMKFGPDGNLYVADARNDRLQVFDSQGTFKYAFGSTGSGPGQFQEPLAPAFYDGKLYVVDGDNNRVQVFRIIPEPSSLPLAAAGLAGVLLLRKLRVRLTSKSPMPAV